MERTLAPFLARDLKRKIVLISGARQCGKTTLARMIEPDHDYFNYDYAPHRLGLKERSWDRRKKLVILDELHQENLRRRGPDRGNASSAIPRICCTSARRSRCVSLKSISSGSGSV